MADARLTKNALTFTSDGSAALSKFTSSANKFTFEGSSSGANVALVGIANATDAQGAATKSQVDAEATARGTAITAEQNARAAAITAEETARTNAIAAEATARGTAITNAVAAEASARADALAAVQAGLHWKQACRLQLDSNADYVYDSGAGTLQAPAVGAGGNIDGVAPAANDRVLLSGQTVKAQNGIYVISALGNGSTKRKYTRASDFDANAELASAAVFVREGTAYGDKAYVLTSDGASIGDNLEFAPLKATLADAEVTQAKIADDAVTQAKIADDAVGGDQIAAGALAAYSGNVTADGLVVPSSGSVQAGSFIATSDRRLKHQFQDLTGGVATDMVNRVPCYSYKFHGQADTRYGTTAQDLLEHEDLSALVHTNPDQSLAVNYTDLIPVLCQSLKDAHSRIDELIQSI